MLSRRNTAYFYLEDMFLDRWSSNQLGGRIGYGGCPDFIILEEAKAWKFHKKSGIGLQVRGTPAQLQP